MSSPEEVLAQLQEARRRFLDLVHGIRPDLHRYCARMTGSIADGEDVVQDTLARAYYELPALQELPALRSWLFQIAHNRALDFLRRYERRMGEPLDPAKESAVDEMSDPDSVLAHEHAVRAAVSRFLELVPLQRSCVILKDVLGHSLIEIATLLGLSTPAVKAALHRGRTRLRELSQDLPGITDARSASPTLLRYAELFNARDWDGVRAMLLEDVKLDLVGVTRRAGKTDVGIYFTNYARVYDWYLVPGRLDGSEVLGVLRTPHADRPDYFIEVSIVERRVAAIRDFRHVPYIGTDLQFEPSRTHE